MRLEIVVAPLSPRAAANAPRQPTAADTPSTVERARGLPARELLDVFIDGANVTARVRETHGAFVLRDLALALVDMARRQRAKAAIRFYDEPWELCVERFGPTACLSVYRTGGEPLVTAYDRAVPFDDVVAATRDAIERLLSHVGPRSGVNVELSSAIEQLRDVPRACTHDVIDVPTPVLVVVEPDRDSSLSFGAEFSIREGAPSPDDLAVRGRLIPADRSDPYEAVERSDTHALLFRGRVRAEIRGRSIDLGECHPILVAERLVELARRAFDAWERGVPCNARSEAAGVLVGVRVSTSGDLALTLGAAHDGPRRTVHTFPALRVADVLEAALAFGRSLVRAILRRDRAQFANLRLGALRRALRESTETLRQARRADSKVNLTPEPYRAFAAALGASLAAAAPAPPATRLRYATRWRAIVPGIDLRTTYLCGDRLIVGAATEMWALDRVTGKVIWRADVTRGTSVVTPDGIARLAPDGALRVHDFGTGEATLRTRIVPRAGGPVAGAVVHLPGLPKLVVVTEGEHHLVAVDLTSGEPRWRWSWGGGRGSARGAPRMKRAGKLVYFTCGDGALTALDVMTGAVVWRLRDRMRFRTPPTVTHDALFVVSGGAHGVARLYRVDLYSGDVRWSTPIAEPTAPCTIEGAPLVAGSAVAIAVRQKSGLVLATFRREDGAPVVTRAPILAPSGTSWLAVDDAFIGNAPTGELVAVDAPTGELRWRQVLGPRPLEADVPRRLEPVLRCGALFVPCSLVSIAGASARKASEHGQGGQREQGDQRGQREQGEAAAAGVSVIRPFDGAVLATIAPTETIPDLLRVDERCDVYVAEESGHVVAFGALPRLSLVR